MLREGVDEQESVERNYLESVESGVDEALRQVDNTVSNHLTRHSLQKSLRTDFVRNLWDIPIYR